MTIFMTHFFGKGGAKPASDAIYTWKDASHWLLPLNGSSDLTGVLFVLCRELPDGSVLRLFAQAGADQAWKHIGSVSNEAPSKTCAWPAVSAEGGLLSQVGVELAVETDADQETPDKQLWQVGERVLYTQRDGTKVGAKIDSVLNCVFPPSFGIKIDGSDDVRETEGNRLAGISKYDKWAFTRTASFRE